MLVLIRSNVCFEITINYIKQILKQHLVKNKRVFLQILVQIFNDNFIGI